MLELLQEKKPCEICWKETYEQAIYTFGFWHITTDYGYFCKDCMEFFDEVYNYPPHIHHEMSI